jgi:hypothetical protein
MLNLVVFLVVFFAAISYAIHLLKQKPNTQPRPQRPKPANESDSGHHGVFDAGHSHGGFDSGHGGFDGGHGGFDGGGGHH